MDAGNTRRAVSQWIHRPDAATGIGLIGITGLYFAEQRTSPDISFEVLYLFLTALVAWSAPRFWVYGIFGAFAALLHVAAGYVRVPPTAHVVSLAWNIAAHLILFVLAGVIVAQPRRMLDAERQRASTDALTGVASRRAFLEMLERETTRSHRYSRPHSVAFIDLDRFHEVNNQYGHARGDAVLVASAQAMLRVLRATDTLGRLGGDEFAILLPETGEEAKVVAEKVRDAVSRAIAREGVDGCTGVSIGLVTCTCSGETQPHRLLGKADDLMYRAKQGGGNSVVHEIIKAPPPPGDSLR